MMSSISIHGGEASHMQAIHGEHTVEFASVFYSIHTSCKKSLVSNFPEIWVSTIYWAFKPWQVKYNNHRADLKLKAFDSWCLLWPAFRVTESTNPPWSSSSVIKSEGGKAWKYQATVSDSYSQTRGSVHVPQTPNRTKLSKGRVSYRKNLLTRLYFSLT